LQPAWLVAAAEHSRPKAKSKLVCPFQISQLSAGRKAITTRPTVTLNQESLVQNMVGREMKERFPKGNRQSGEVILNAENLQAVDPNDPSHKVLSGVSFDLKRGEILGIAGLMGSGRTELVTTIFDEYGKLTAGTIQLDGKPIQIKSARDAMKVGIRLVPEDRKGQGLVLTFHQAVV
jgi:D-xylose transport system ATP-binding protein